MVSAMMPRWAAQEESPDAHVHVRVESRDCDGDYLRAYIYRPEPYDPGKPMQRAQDAFDLLRMVVFDRLPWSEETTLIRLSDGSFEWHEATDEGYRHVHVQPCEKACSDDDRNLVYDRDLTAERAGY